VRFLCCFRLVVKERGFAACYLIDNMDRCHIANLFVSQPSIRPETECASIGAQAGSPRQLRLPLVKGPEVLRLQLQGGSHVQCVQSADP